MTAMIGSVSTLVAVRIAHSIKGLIIPKILISINKSFRKEAVYFALCSSFLEADFELLKTAKPFVAPTVKNIMNGTAERKQRLFAEPK
jgi:hypothetical protein